MASDSHKGILGIKYNSLNLPYELLIKNTETSGKVYYTYTASGVKLNTKHMKAKNLGYTPATGGTWTRDPFIGLGHEMAHIEDKWRGTIDLNN